MAVRLRRAATQSMPNGGPTAIVWDTEDEDPDGFWSTGSTLTVPTGRGGMYVIGVAIEVQDGLNFVNNRTFLDLYAGGWTWRAWCGMDNPKHSIGTLTRLGDYDTVRSDVYQSTGGARNITARLTMARVSD